MYVAMTKVSLKPGTYQRCASLFQNSNPGLVSDEPDWLGAQMIFDHDTNIVTVLATWKDLKSYERLSSSATFQQTMGKFRELFAGPPEITLNEVLVNMHP